METGRQDEDKADIALGQKECHSSKMLSNDVTEPRPLGGFTTHFRIYEG